MSLQSLNENRRGQSQPKLPYSTDALRCDLRRVRDAWRESRRRHDRFSVYQYLGAVFDLVMMWEIENRAVDRAKRALWLKRREAGDNIEPFAAVINCTSSRKKIDAKARSKWARALIFAAEYKSPAEPLEHFIRRHGGINLCAAELSRLSRTKSPTR
jgi:xanthine/CO dehydrogenase XdhC/CoxF family maturation factor